MSIQKGVCESPVVQEKIKEGPVRTIALATLVLVALVLLPACGSSARFSAEEAMGAQKVEMQFNAKGKLVEVEYHISPDQVPDTVRQAMDALHPGGRFTGAEKETHKGKLYYELTRVVMGMEVEAMFLPDGTLYQEEVQVREHTVPEAVRETARAALAGARVTKWEEIRDMDRKLIEYHVKMASGGMNYKVLIALDGKLINIYREIPAELEVPKS
jgi:hypothetical protein